MQTASSLSPKDSQAEEDRETFSHQTLLLTALTAINNHHPSFNDYQISQERLEYMRDKATHTPIIDAATTILVTDTEILATMACGVDGTTHSLVALREIGQNENTHVEQLLNSGNLDFQMMNKYDEYIPGDFDLVENGPATYEAQAEAAEHPLFVSFPNINTTVPMQAPGPTARSPIDSSQQSSMSRDSICTPIVIEEGHWSQIMASKSGFVFGSK